MKGEFAPFAPGHHRIRPLEERFWEKVDKNGPNGCWVWTAAKADTGYGQIGVGGKIRYVHRIVFELVNRTIPEGAEIDHLCRNRPCVNPEHLEPVTCAENNRRKPTTLLTSKEVDEIRASTELPLDLAERFGVSRAHIYSIRLGRCWVDTSDQVVCPKCGETDRLDG